MILRYPSNSKVLFLAVFLQPRAIYSLFSGGSYKDPATWVEDALDHRTKSRQETLAVPSAEHAVHILVPQNCA